MIQPATTGRLGNQLSHFAYALELAQRLDTGVSYASEPTAARMYLAQGPSGVTEIPVGDWTSAPVQVYGLWPAHEPPAEIGAAIRELIPSPLKYDSCAVHIRRTDYLEHAELNQLTPDYYCRAMSALTGPFTIFTDDPEWARYQFPDIPVVPPGDASSDLRTMAAHRHHIIANSTFSWWAAFLARRPGQVVISPRDWFRSASQEFVVTKF